MDSGAAQFPVWLEWTKALGPALAVVVSAFAVLVSVLTFHFTREIGRWQQSVSRAQMRQNVYDRRFRIYESAKGLFVTFQRDGELSADDYMTFIQGISDAVFLLDTSIVSYLEQIREKTGRLLLLREKIRETVGTGAPEYHVWVDESAAVEQWFLRQFDVLVSKFKPSMQLGEP